jgi:putrescine transport system ATP-binding protein
MDRGRLIQVATPQEIYERPNSRWVADFIGEVNLIEGRVIDVAASGTVVVSAAAGRLRALSPEDAKPGDVVWVALRPEKVRIAPKPPGFAEENCVAGEVTDIGYLGDLSIYKVRLDSGTIMKTAVANVTRLAERPIAWDERVWLTWAPEAAMVLTR